MFKPRLNADGYGECINGEDTYEGIAVFLKENDLPLVIGWSDGLGTHYDILLSFNALFAGGEKQGGILCTDLFVAVMRRGAFGFKTNQHQKYGIYVAEKLGLENGKTSALLADLINGIIRKLL